MADLHDEFDKEPDLAASFEAEQDAGTLDKLKGKASSALQSISDVASDIGENYAKPILETGLDFARAAGQGATIGASDEITGALSALGEATYNKFNPTDTELREKGFDIKQPSLTDLYRQNQQAIQNENIESQKRSPWASAAGQIAGGITSGGAIAGALGIGQKVGAVKSLAEIAKNEGKLKALAELGIRGAKNYKEALPLIMAETALSSEKGGLTSIDEAKQLGLDVAGGAAFGLPAVMGLSAVSEVAAPQTKKLAQNLNKFLEDKPLYRQMLASREYGLEGINPKSQSQTLDTTLGKTGLSELDNTRAKQIMDEIYSADKKVSQAVGQSLIDAENAGQVINIQPEIKDTLSQVSALADKYPELAQNNKAKQIFSKIAEAGNDVTPTEAKELINYMDAYINKFKSATNKTPLEEGILGNLYKARKEFSNTLKTQVPQYGDAAERMASFRNLVPETIVSGNRPVDVKDIYFGDLNNQDQKLFDQLKKLVQGTTKEGTATQPVRESFVQSMKGMKQFEADEAQRLASGKIKESALQRPVSAIEDQIKKWSDDAVARGSMDALDPHTGTMRTLKSGLLSADTGRSALLSASNLEGRIERGLTKNPIAKMSRAIFNAPDATINSLSNKLKSTPGLEKYGENLEQALQSSNTHRRNQVLFTIMQNPSARALVGDQAEEKEQ